MKRPHAPASEENKTVIFEAIREYLGHDVLEIGSGTGQHAVYFAQQRPDMVWQTSDLADSLPGIAAWIEFSKLPNLPPPIELDVLGSWPDHRYDTIYSANCFHIMNAKMVSQAIRGGADCLLPGGRFAVYGPFNYGGEYTAPSNARFDQFLKEQDPDSGIRDFEWLDGLARRADMVLLDDVAMPANNRTIVWQKRTL